MNAADERALGEPVVVGVDGGISPRGLAVPRRRHRLVGGKAMACSAPGLYRQARIDRSSAEGATLARTGGWIHAPDEERLQSD